jgi:hypothetical protein
MDIWWKRLDVVPSEKNTVKDFLEEQNFTWKILSRPCYMKVDDEYKIIPNHQISIRSDNLRPIAVVKNRYKLLDNDKCFEIADEFKKVYPQSKFVSCGDIMNQKESYLSMILKKEIINNDEFGVWITFTNGFDGRNAVNATLTLIKSKDHTVFQLFDKEHPRVWTMGRIDIKSKFQTIYRDIEKYIDYAKELCENMNKIEVNLNECVNSIFEISWKKKKRTNKNLAFIKECVREIYIKNNGKNLYDLFFSFSDFYCNGKRFRTNKLGDDKRFQMAMVKYFYDLHDYWQKILAFVK